jgi:AcrR family transcriptional regulator
MADGRKLFLAADRGAVPAEPHAKELSTRERILRCARAIILSKGEEAASMTAVAEAAGVSRQAVYLHFADRTELLLELADYLDRAAGLGNWVDEVAQESDGRMRLHRMAELRHARSVALKALVRSVEGARHRDEAAAKAWRRRFNRSVKWMSSQIVSKLAQEGRVHPSWDHKDAAALLVVLFSFRAWDDLTHDARWSASRYIETLTSAALGILSSPCNKSK